MENKKKLTEDLLKLRNSIQAYLDQMDMDEVDKPKKPEKDDKKPEKDDKKPEKDDKED